MNDVMTENNSQLIDTLKTIAEDENSRKKVKKLEYVKVKKDQVVIGSRNYELSICFLNAFKFKFCGYRFHYKKDTILATMSISVVLWEY